jgi:hypothetical protein
MHPRKSSYVTNLRSQALLAIPSLQKHHQTSESDPSADVLPDI